MKTRWMEKWKHISGKQRIACIGCLCLLGVTAAVLTGISVLQKTGGAEITSSQEQKGDRPQTEAVTAAGYVAYGSIPQEFTLTLSDGDTSAPLEVEKVSVSNEDTVAEGDELLKVTDESYEKAKAFLEKVLKKASSALVTEQLNYTKAKLEAEYTYVSDAALNASAKAEYESKIAELEEKVSTAQEDLDKANSTVNDNPTAIASNEEQIADLNSESQGAEADLQDIQNELAQVKTEYQEKSKDYASALNEFRTVLTVYQYLQSYRGKDTSQLDAILSQVIAETSSLAEADAALSGTLQDTGNAGSETKETSGSQPSQMATAADVKSQSRNLVAVSTQSSVPASDSSQESGEQSGTEEPAAVSGEQRDLDAVTEKLEGEYAPLKASYEEIKASFETVKSRLETLQKQATACQTTISTAKQSLSTLNQENSQLQQELEKAQNQLSSLESAYTAAINNQITEMVSIKESYKSSMISYEYAQNNYDVTVANLDKELKAAEDEVAAARSNAEFLESSCRDGILRASRSGTIQMVGYKEGDELSAQMPVVMYQDTSSRSVTVSVEQSDITEVEVGDTAMVYIENAGQLEGSVTAVSTQAASQSISSVSYSVTVTITGDDGELENGTSAAVFFNLEGNGMQPQISGQGQNQEEGQEQSQALAEEKTQKE